MTNSICTKVCEYDSEGSYRSDEEKTCRGCGRTVAEVADWVFMSDEQKEKVWVRILAEGYPRRNT